MKRLLSAAIIVPVILFIGSYSLVFAGDIKPRYISLAPSTTEILFALGLNDEITGVSIYCNYPPEAKSKEKIGDFSNPNIEKIISLRPDYIFSTGLEQAQIVAKLKQLGLKVYVADPTNVKELFNTITEIGAITGKSKEADYLVKDMQKRIQVVVSKVETRSCVRKPKVFIEIWDDPLTTAGGGSFVDELIGLAGGINISHDTKRPYSIFSQEEVINRDPDCVILAYMARELPEQMIKNRLGWSSISAVRNKRIYNDIDPNLILRPGPRVCQGLEELYRRFYLQDEPKI